MKLFLFLLTWSLSVINEISAQQINPRVTVSEGVIVGDSVLFSESNYINVTILVDQFLGVPFADPPVRFAPPEPKTPWTRDLLATQYKPACTQGPSLVFSLDSESSEDCLYLNVFAPNPKPSGAAVMVWIHGGAFISGTAGTDFYNGVPLVATGDVIVVTINYRLGVFSQFSTKDEVAPGNMGMLDQVAALKWVYENIEAFGGDKDRITISGESAGAASVGFHLLSKLSRNYFSQAILQSGSSLASWAFVNDPEQERQQAFNIGKDLGCNGTDSRSLVQCLQNIDADVLRASADQVMSSTYNVNVDGNFLEDTPVNLYRRGDVKHAPILSGVNADEGTFVLLASGYQSPPGTQDPPYIGRAALRYIFTGLLGYVDGLDDEVALDAVMEEYIDWTIADDQSASFFRSAVDGSGDSVFQCPHDALLRAHARANDTVFSYYMTHAPSVSVFGVPIPWLGATHAEDLAFVFGVPFIPSLADIRLPLTDAENLLSVRVMEFWTNFAKSGDPSKPDRGAEPGEGMQAWPAFTIPELRHKELSLELGEVRAVRAAQCHFWNEYLPELALLAGTIDEDEREWKSSYNEWKDHISDWEDSFRKYQALTNN